MRTDNMSVKRLFLWMLPTLAVSCTQAPATQNERLGPQPDDIVYATIENPHAPSTKVYADGQLRVLWNAGDRICYFPRYSFGYEYRFLGEDGDNAGAFQRVPVEDPVTGADLDGVYAVYPYSSGTRISYDGVITCHLPSVQRYLADSFGPGANTMVSKTDDSELHFKNAGGYLSFKLYGGGISVSSLSLQGNSGERLAGKCTIDMSTGIPAETMDPDESTESVTLECNPPVVLDGTSDAYVEFWFVLPPVTFSNGFTLTVNTEDGRVFEKSTSGSFTIERNKIRRMAPLEVIPAKPVRVLYWNIQNGMWDGQRDNYDRFVNFVRDLDPDICVWAEAQTIYYTGSETEMPANHRYLVNGWGELAARYGHGYWGVGAHRDNYPQVITSKYPLTYISRLAGAEPDSVVTHGSGWATVEVNGRTLNLVTVHTWPQAYAYRASDRESSIAAHGGDLYRVMELKYICEHTIGTDTDAGNHLWMMMGDFNSRARTDNAWYNYDENDTRFLVQDYILANTPYVDLIKERYPDEFKPTAGYSRLDYVYCTRALYDRITFADVILDEYTTRRRDYNTSYFWIPSDHYPMVIDFSVE